MDGKGIICIIDCVHILKNFLYYLMKNVLVKKLVMLGKNELDRLIKKSMVI